MVPRHYSLNRCVLQTKGNSMNAFSDPASETLLRTVSLSNGFNAWLDVELVAAGNGQVEIALPVRAELLQHHGFVHGGVVGALADIACSWAAATAAGDIVTSGYTLQFLSPAKAPRLRATATVVKAGKRQVTVEAKIYAEPDDEAPKLVAMALASIAPVGSGS